jgi:pimeloyl-ACP methyl ester carboxylesterase
MVAPYWLPLTVHVNEHPADIAIGVLEPGDYQLKHEVKMTDTPPGAKPGYVMNFNMTFHERVPRPSELQPKGTIFILHGVMMTKESMLHWGFCLAEHGYRTVLVDLRGHGQSTGDVIAFGAFETADLTEVLNELSKRGLVAGPIGVLGLSYGGAIGLLWAAKEPRVETVVALAPFCDAREAIGQFAHAMMPKLISGVSKEALFAAYMKAAARGGFDWEKTDVLAATRRLRTPVLLLHGANDEWIPPSHSKRIEAVAPPGSQLLIGQGDHVTLSIRLHPIDAPVTAWFDRQMRAQGN